MSSPQEVILFNHKSQAVQRFHPWIFSGAIKKLPQAVKEGDVVQIRNESGQFLGLGHYAPGSIAIRVFSFEPADNLPQLWIQKFRDAYRKRVLAGLAESKETNAYRLIFAEGDGMPGLIVDWYHGTAVVQCHSKGMYRHRFEFVEALKEIYGARLNAVYDKSASALHSNEKQATGDGYLLGSAGTGKVMEHGHAFLVSWEEGQKTGFFVDQRENRKLLGEYAAGKSVLNTFCYSGGFSVYALHAGAALVHSVDSSAKATRWTDENVALNGFGNEKHQSYTADVFDFFKQSQERYEVIILDPPAFAKGLGAKHNALKAYKRLNLEALKRIKPGGILFTFSCSQVITPDLFQGAVTAAAIEAGRQVSVLNHLSQPADHPVSIFHPEGLYLKGLVLFVA